MDNDLIIDIGADLSGFTSAMKTAEKAFRDLRRLTEGKPIKLTVEGMVKQLKTEQAAYKVFSAKIKAEAKRTNTVITKIQIQEMFKRDQANKKALAKQVSDTAKKAKAVVAIEKKQTALVNNETKKRNPWGNIESIGHAARTTALYGAMAQALFGVQDAFRSTIAEAMRFDQSIQQNIAVLNKTADEAKYLAKSVIGLGIAYGMEFEEIQEGMITLGRAGVEGVEQLKQGTEGLAALSIVTGDAMHYGAAAMASLLAVYPELNTEMKGLTNNMAAVANATRLGLEDFSTISNYALTTAKSIGLSAKAYLGLAGALSKVGLNASTIGTSIRRLDKFTLDSAESVQNFFRIAGQSQDDFAKSLRDSKDGGIQAMADFTNRLARMTEEQFAAAVGDLNIQLRATAKALRAVGELNEFEDMIDKMEEGRDVTEQAKEAAIGLDAAWIRVKNTLKTVYSEEIRTMLKDMLSTNNAAEFLRTLAEIKKAFTTMIIGIKLGFGAVHLLISGMVLLFGEGANLIYKAWDELTVGLHNLFINTFKLIGKFFTLFINWLLEQINKFVNSVTGLANAIAKVLGIDFKISSLTLQIGDFTSGLKEATVAGEELIDLEFSRTKVNEAYDGISENIDKLLKSNEQYEQKLKDIAVIEAKRKKELGSAPKILGHDYSKDAEILAEIQRKAEILNGTWTKEKEIKGKIKSITEEILRLSKEEQDPSKFKDNTTAILKLQSELMTEQVNLKKELQRLDAKGSKAGKEAERLSVFQIKVLKERVKQEMILAKIKGVGSQNLLDLELKNSKLNLKLAIEAANQAGKLVKSKRTQLAYDKLITDVYKAQLDVKEDELAIAHQYTDVFDNLINGNAVGAFTDAMEHIRESLADTLNIQPMSEAFSALLKDMLTGFTDFSNKMDAVIKASIWGFIVSLGIKLISSLGSTVSDAELKAAEGITDVQSESIVNSLSAIEDIDVLGLTYTQDMMYSLRSLVSYADTASANIGLDYTGDNYVGSSSEILGGIWGSSSTELLATGIILNPATIAELTEGQLTGNAYLKELVSSSSFFGLLSSQSIRTTDLGALDRAILEPIEQAYLDGIEAIESAALAFGMSTEEFAAMKDTWETSLSELNFEGKSAEEISEMIVGTISRDLDLWADTLSNLTQYVEEYKKAGEGTAETLIRLVYDYETVSATFALMGADMNALTDGGLRMAEALAEAAGSMENFLDKLNYFIQNFYTDDERAIFQTEILTATFASLGETLPTTVAGMKALINAKIAEIKVMALEIDTQIALAESTLIATQALEVFGSVAYLAAQEIYDGTMLTIEALKASLALQSESLDAILATLPMWTAVYGTANDAADALENLYASLVDIATLQADWLDSDLASAKLILEAVRKETELFGVTIENFLVKFTSALNAEGTMEQDDFDAWSMLSSALKAVEDAINNLLQIELDSLNSQLDFYENILKTIQDAYAGSLSYLNSIEKADYLEQTADDYLSSGDIPSYLDTLASQLEYEKAMSITKEDYIPLFDDYINALQDAEYVPEATTEDVVEQIEITNGKLDGVMDAIEKAAYQPS